MPNHRVENGPFFGVPNQAHTSPEACPPPVELCSLRLSVGQDRRLRTVRSLLSPNGGGKLGSPVESRYRVQELVGSVSETGVARVTILVVGQCLFEYEFEQARFEQFRSHVRP